jgi:hypothetical protein
MNTKQTNDTRELESLTLSELSTITGGKGFLGTVWDGAKEVGSWAAAPLYNHGYQTGSSCGEV